MEVRKYLSGGAAYRVKHQVAETFANAGVVALVGTEAEAGLDLSTTTGCVDAVGLVLDTATYVTAQQADWPTNTAERQVLVDIRPDAVLFALFSGGATDNTAMTLYDVTTASTDGLAVTTGDDWSSPEFDDGALWGYDGANMGQLRKITSTTTTAATVTVALEVDTIVGDNFLRAPVWPFDDQSDSVTLTTNLTQVRSDSAVTASGADLLPIEIQANTVRNGGRTTSGVFLIFDDHWLKKRS